MIFSEEQEKTFRLFSSMVMVYLAFKELNIEQEIETLTIKKLEDINKKLNNEENIIYYVITGTYLRELYKMNDRNDIFKRSIQQLAHTTINMEFDIEFEKKFIVDYDNYKTIIKRELNANNK